MSSADAKIAPSRLLRLRRHEAAFYVLIVFAAGAFFGSRTWRTAPPSPPPLPPQRSPYEERGPPTKQELGQAGWTLLHTMAANFPERPTARQQARAVAFLRALGDLYPCELCASHFRMHMQQHPIASTSREELSLWMCEAHNEVNVRNGKEAYYCDIGVLCVRVTNELRARAHLPACSRARAALSSTAHAACGIAAHAEGSGLAGEARRPCSWPEVPSRACTRQRQSMEGLRVRPRHQHFGTPRGGWRLTHRRRGGSSIAARRGWSWRGCQRTGAKTAAAPAPAALSGRPHVNVMGRRRGVSLSASRRARDGKTQRVRGVSALSPLSSGTHREVAVSSMLSCYVRPATTDEVSVGDLLRSAGPRLVSRRTLASVNLHVEKAVGNPCMQWCACTAGRTAVSPYFDTCSTPGNFLQLYERHPTAHFRKNGAPTILLAAAPPLRARPRAPCWAICTGG